MDTSFIETLAQIAPDLMEEMELRALVLERVAALGPIGRRALAMRLHLTEREVRAAASALKSAGLLEQYASGMELSSRGQGLVEAARLISRERRTLSSMERALAGKLSVERVCLVPGDADRDESVIAEIGRTAARQIRCLLEDAHVLAISGGRLVAAAAEAMSMAAPVDVMVVPANGGYGSGGLNLQANALAERMAAQLGGACRLLHLPDGISPAAAAELCAHPQVRETLELLSGAQALLYSAEDAQTMAKYRGMSTMQAADLGASGAVGEALGYYFDAAGRVVGGTSPALRAQWLGKRIRAALLVGGKSRAQAALSVLLHHPHRLLVIDEAAAGQILDLLRV